MKWKKACVCAFVIACILVVTSLVVYFFTSFEHNVYKGGIVTNGIDCAIIGREIFEKGGSAVDIAIAALFCEGVAVPQSMGLGGGFIMTIYDRRNNKVDTLNAREVAPGKAHKDMYKDNSTLAQFGGLAAAVPGELRGYWEAHQKYGVLPWSSLIEPSIHLCKNGIFVTKYFAGVLKEREDVLRNNPTLKEAFINPTTDRPYEEGAWLKRPKLGETLEVIAREGASALYNGNLTKGFVKDIQDMGGIIDEEDMRVYKPRWADPLQAKLDNGNVLYTMEPPTSGVILILILNILRSFLDSSGMDSIVNVQRTIESFKYSFAKRNELGDVKFVDIQKLIQELLSEDYAINIRNQITDNRTFQDPTHYGYKYSSREDHGTAHISVITPNGDAVAVTSTVNLVFGAKFISPSTGILLNNEMDDFSAPAFANYFEVPPSPANFIAPGKIPLSSMCPVIVLNKNREPILVTGAAGGTKIVTSVAEIIARILWFNETVENAIAAPRFHHQLIPMTASVETNYDSTIREALQRIGHKVEIKDAKAGFSAVTGLAKIDKSIQGGFDPRRQGLVALFK